MEEGNGLKQRCNSVNDSLPSVRSTCLQLSVPSNIGRSWQTDKCTGGDVVLDQMILTRKLMRKLDC